MTTGQFFMIVIGICGVFFAVTVLVLRVKENTALLRDAREMLRRIITSDAFLDAHRARMSGRPRQGTSALTPIKHEAPTGPAVATTSAKVDIGVQAGYFIPKGAPSDCDSLIAIHYDGRHLDKSIPEDSYILLGTDKKIPGDTFRQLYEPAAVGIVVDAPRKPKTSTFPKKFKEVEAQPPSEEEKKMAEEYELPAAEAVEQEFAAKKAPWTL